MTDTVFVMCDICRSYLQTHGNGW